MLTLVKTSRLSLVKPELPATIYVVGIVPHVTLEHVFKALRSQSRNNMTYSKIMDALESGKQVYWTNLRYSVKMDRVTGKLCIKDAYSDYYSGLQPSEVRDCFTRDC